MIKWLFQRTIQQQAKNDVDDAEKHLYNCERRLEMLISEITFLKIRLQNLKRLQDDESRSPPNI